jgi:hypothetical protein
VPLGADGAAVDLDAVGVGDVARGVGHLPAADRHATREDELLGGAAGRDSGVGEVLPEAHGLPTLA